MSKYNIAETPDEDPRGMDGQKRIAWQAWREGWNRKSATDELTPIGERTAREQFETWWSQNHE